ncbi:hypothetical protein COW36_15205 [bacterium (Candidatus Blackallbacteria) CG17_big_fil_post_rev_8_21_14_2_50_48_46]|uniref:Pirin family protein n=1 Tax=bacterium (Candidatus Blackallbacteria) CG17_big_fil_post_rev_8_21_14_2_50_48_46 TaxID=2014261 RepID=A0A2M7G2M8_9BACT|nr:MAG: hypothetical protein COW64_11345 [bacterium (Candidatus Blackallbacteria) CG18_big_fil_WC_8_21_14_2_50_49_26]PIW16058.1 MAG: hypothetical protein COW36_15205 [bacterium (Candidatus Blackallbacteria) CG17_big_fil_post_rev_8_21_14_2_50_48_46]PIW50470.1 MAG: hypothetical protein COW20_02920 [bacterium (Candidatus Blackallbacteria) CG13_big_fil_rev_8_21_14_2_50_49_14]
MKKILHRADSRGVAEHGWLHSYHTFSFAGYYHPERMHFGALRVLNDDRVQGGKGFGQHPHQNMEIISIPLSGALAHRDNMGNVQVIHEQDVQIMSAGTGVFHSEYNDHADQEVNFLQIWILPEKLNIRPRYEQRTFSVKERLNVWQTVVSPQRGEGVWINQQAWFCLADLEQDHRLPYTPHATGQGLYLFVLEGEVSVAGETLSARDGLGVWELNELTLNALSDAKVLMIEVPMQFETP